MQDVPTAVFCSPVVLLVPTAIQNALKPLTDKGQKKPQPRNREQDTNSSVLVTSRQTPNIPSSYTKYLVNPYRMGPKNPIRIHKTNSSIVVICGDCF